MLHSALRRRGSTLTELLIVIIVMLTVVAIALPIAKKVLDDSHIREASRQLNAYLTMAKARAAQTGRPCGIYMQCDRRLGDPPTSTIRQVTQFYLAEVPPPFAGSMTNARGKIFDPAYMNGQREFQPVNPDGTPIPANQNGELLFLLDLIQPGEFFLVRFDYKGEWFRCQRGYPAHPNPNFRIPTKLYYLGTLHGLPAPLPPGYNDNGTTILTPGRPFQILRGPHRVGSPLELPAGACVDLVYSGMTSTGAGSRVIGGAPQAVPQWGGFPADQIVSPPVPQPTDLQALTIMFKPSGGVDSIYVNQSLPCTPSGTIHLLVGRVEKVSDPSGVSASHPTGLNLFDPATSNLADPTSLWVSIGLADGSVITTENLPPPVDQATLSTTNVTIFPSEPPPPGGRQQNLNPALPAPPALSADRMTFLTYCREVAIARNQMAGR